MGKMGYREYVTCVRPVGARAEMLPSSLALKPIHSCLRELKQGLCINLEGWDGEGDGKEVQEGGDISIHKADSC